MKTIIKTLALSAIAAMTLWSCAEEPIQPEELPGENIEQPEVTGIPLTIAVGAETKTVFDEKSRQAYWQKTDKLYVFDNENAGVEFTADQEGSALKASTTFSTENWTGKTPLYAAYSRAAAPSSTSTGVLRVKVPSEQMINNANSFAQTANPSVGKVEMVEEAYVVEEMKNVGALIVFTFKDGTQVTSVTIEGGNGEQVAGEVDVTYSDLKWAAVENGAATKVELTSNASNAKLSTDGCFRTRDDAGNILKYYAVILPGTYSKGLKFTLKMKDGSTLEKTVGASAGLTVERNSVKGFDKAIDFTGEEEDFVNIYNLETLQAFLTSATDGQVGKLTANIDCGGDNPYVATFIGILDGNGHKIYNFKRTTKTGAACLIATLSGNGVIKNVIFGSADGKTYDGTSELKNTEVGSSNLNFGIVGEVKDNAVMSDVTNYCKITTVGTVGEKAHIRLGGLVGLWRAGTGSNLRNYGSVTAKFASETAPLGQSLYGGVIGYALAGSLKDIENYGEVTAESGTYANLLKVGGVLGHSDAAVNGGINDGPVSVNGVTSTSILALGGLIGQSGAVDITSPENRSKGTVSVIGGSYKDFRVGGIVGETSIASSAITSAVNHGAVTVAPAGENGVSISGAVYVGGVAGYASAAAFDLDNAENHGAIDAVFTPGAYGTFIGGILGRINGTATATVQKNKNYGSITVTSNGGTKAVNVGGISSQVGGLKYEDCENYGDIVCAASSGNSLQVGGIAAQTGGSFKGSLVEADITVNAKKDESWVGGIVGYTSAAASSEGWSYKGTIDASASTAKIYAGGWLGKTNAASPTYLDNVFEGEVKGGSGENYLPGLCVGGMHSASVLSHTFGTSEKPCKIVSGAKLNGAAVTELSQSNVFPFNFGGTATVNLTNISIVTE